MGMIDYIEIRGELATKLARAAGLDLENHMQTKALKPVGAKYLLTDNGIFEYQSIEEPTGEIKTYEIADVVIEYAITRPIGERTRATYFVGDIQFSGVDIKTGKFERYVARYRKTDSNKIKLTELFKGEAIQELHNRGPWEERYYDLGSTT